MDPRAMGQGLAAMRRWSRAAGIRVRDEAGLRAEIAERRERTGWRVRG
jgi:hypothetical protein